MDHESITRDWQQHKVDKDWGYEVWLANTSLYCGKKLYINDGCGSSLHFHVDKTETILVASGELTLILIDQAVRTVHYLGEGDTILITPGLTHQLIAEAGDVVLYEFSTEHFDADSYRIQRFNNPKS